MARAHRHDDIEVNVAPVALTYLLGGQTIALAPNTVACFWAARPHRLDADLPGESFFWLTVPLQLFLSWNLPTTFVTSILTSPIVVADMDEPTSETVARFRHWEQDLGSGPPLRPIAQLEIEAFLRRVALTALVGANSVLPARNSPLSAASRMALFISENFNQEIRVNDIARHVHLHPQYAMAMFRRVMGITLGGYLTLTRVSQAQRLLITTSASIADVAAQSGFSSLSAFYDRFGGECGTSPAAYRRAHHNPLTGFSARHNGKS